MKKNVFWFIGIILLAIGLRFYQLGQVPPSPNWDEVALGYNAFSILQTGRDEYGKFMPIIMRSYDDYKPALYSYLIIPGLFVFDLTVFAVRFPGALFGVISVIATYFLVKELFTLAKKETSPYGEPLALLSSFLLAISPWHIQFSRIAFESQVGDSFNILGVLFLLKGLRKPWYLFPSVFFFAINPYMYQSDKVFTPLLVLALLLIFKDTLLALPRKYVLAAFVVGVILITPMAYETVTNKQALARAQGVSVFSDKTELLKGNVVRLQKSKEEGDIIGLLLNNRRVIYAKTVAANYLSHFDINWLFITGDLARHHAPNMGLLYLWELPFVFIGIYQLLFGSWSRKAKLTIFSWLLIAPIPASITSGVPHAVRTLNFLPTWQIFTALGLVTCLVWMKAKEYRISNMIVASILVVFATWNVSYYLNQYFVQQNYVTSEDWQYGYKEAVTFVKEHESEYQQIIVTNKPHLDQSYMFFLYYLKYDPARYQKEAINASGGFRENHEFGKYSFRPLDWEKEVKSKDILYVGRPSDFPEGVNVVKEVSFVNGKPAIVIVRGE